MGFSEEYYKSVPESYFKKHDYAPYNIEKFDRESLDEIKECLKKSSYNDREMVQEHLQYLEQLANKVQGAILAEKSEGEVTWELEHDLVEINKIFEQVENVFTQYFTTK